MPNLAKKRIKLTILTINNISDAETKNPERFISKVQKNKVSKAKLTYLKNRFDQIRLYLNVDIEEPEREPGNLHTTNLTVVSPDIHA